MCFSCKCLRWTVSNIRSVKCNGSNGHDGLSMPFDFKFPFQNESVLIKSNLINEMTNQLEQQMKSKMQVEV